MACGLVLRSYGIINANLANDYSADDSCTMHMWRTGEGWLILEYFGALES
jgi:hypothetical protein